MSTKTVLTVPAAFGRAVAAARLFTEPGFLSLSAMWLTVKGNTAWLTSMDRDATALFRRPVKVLAGSDITVALNAALLDDAWRAFPRGEVTVTLEKKAEEDAGSAKFTPVGMTFKMTGMDAEPPGFPTYGKALREADGKAVLTGEDFQRLIKIAAPIARDHLEVVLLEAEDGRLRAVASDGYRLAVASADAEVPEAWRIAVYPTTLKKIARVIGANDEVRLTSDGDHLLVETDEAIILLGKYAYGFPDYRQVIPQGYRVRITASVDDLKQALKQVAVIAKRDGAPVRLEVVDKTRCILSVRGETGEMQVTLPATVEGEIGMVIGFSAAYMQDGVDRLDAPLAVIDLQEPTRPILLTEMGGGDFKYVLMPMHLQEETAEAEVARQPEPAAA